MPLQRWSVAMLMAEFIKDQKATIHLVEADMNNWLLNTDNTIVIKPNAYSVFFKKLGGGVWEASLQFDHSVRVERGLRFK